MIDAAFDWGEPAFGAARVAEGQVVESAVERVAQALAGFELGQGWLEGSKSGSVQMRGRIATQISASAERSHAKGACRKLFPASVRAT